MSISLASQSLKKAVDKNITDLDHPEMINEKGLYSIFEAMQKERYVFGLYLAHKTLKLGLESAYDELDLLVLKLKESCCGIEVEGVRLVSFNDRLFVYRIDVKILV